MRPRSPRTLLPVFIGLTLTACVETDPPDEQGPLLLPDSSADARLGDTALPAADAMATVDATAVDATAVDATAHEDLDPPDADRPVEPPPAPFGAACTRPSDCTPAALRWPACLDDTCPPEDCTYPGLADDYGYCTRDCTRDEQCEGAIDGPYGSAFSCLTDGTRGTCVPGSGAACVLRGGQQCEAPDEVCRFGRIYTPDRDYGGTCQTPTREGEPIGAACDRCAEIPAGAVAPGESCSDARPCRTESLCLSADGESFCSAACRRSRDCAEGMLCFAIDFGGGQGGVCVPADLFETGGSADPCQSDDDCRQDSESCQLRIITADRPQAERVCLWAPGDGPAGADCEAPTDCFSGDCHPRDGDGGDGYCRAPCRADRDCGDGFTCEAVVPVPGVDPIDLCQPIEAPPR